MCFEEGIDKSEQIASAMGCDVKRVYGLKRKLLRKASAIMKIMRQE
jgi:DNA-binding CsgD family transcriptional regulator